MSMAERKTMTRAVKNPVKRKLTRAEKKEIAAVIQAAKGDGKPHTAQQTIPYLQMYPDGICRVTEKKYSKSLVFEDINYQLAQADDKTAIFENWCDFLNYFDASVSVQLSFINQGTQREQAEKAINIPAQDDAFNSIRTEYSDMLKNQLSKGNNGLVKHKYITFSIEADNPAAAKARLSRIETDVLNNFKVLGASARPMTGYERLNVLHGVFHPEGKPFSFDFSWLAPSGLSTKDFIAPSSFHFGEGRYFRMGRKIGAVSFLEILAPELNDRMLADILDLETGVIVNLHIRSIDQTEAIKTIKRKITDLDKMKIEEQKKAVRSGYDMDIIPSDLATFGSEAKNLLQDLQSRNERMFLLTFLVVNMADTKRKLENDIFAAAGIAQKYNCALTRLDYQQEAGLMSSIPLGENLIAHAVKQRVELPPLRQFFRCLIREKELVYGYVITGYKLIKDLQAWLLPFVFNIRKVARGNVHFVAYFLAAFISACPRCFYGLPESCKVIQRYWSFCHNNSPNYILLFLSLLGYAYTVPTISQNNSYYCRIKTY